MTRKTKASPAEPTIDPWVQFLDCVRRYPSRTAALDRCGLEHSALSERLAHNKDFADAYSAAFEDGLSSLEDVVVERAVMGVEEPVFHQGVIVGYKTKYSDGLLMFFLEAHRKKYRGVDADQRRSLSDDAREHLRRIFADIEEDTEDGGGDTKVAAVIPKRKKGRPSAA